LTERRQIFSDLDTCFDVTAGGGGNGLVAMGTQPMAAALAKGSQAATEAMLFGAMIQKTVH